MRTKGKIGLNANGRHESECGIVNTGKIKRVGQKMLISVPESKRV